MRYRDDIAKRLCYKVRCHVVVDVGIESKVY